MANYARIANFGDPLEQDWQKNNLVTVVAPNGQRFVVHKDAAPSFQGLLNDLGQSGYDVKSDGGFNYRNIRGSDKLSQHAFGNAIDVNAASNPLGSRKTDLPANINDIASNRGLEWGGNWQSRPDPMHFEWAGKPITTVNSPAADGFEMPSQTPPQQQPTMLARGPNTNSSPNAKSASGDQVKLADAASTQEGSKGLLDEFVPYQSAPKQDDGISVPNLSTNTASPAIAMMLGELLNPRRLRGLI